MKIPLWIQKIKNPRVSKKEFIPIYAPIFIGNEKTYVRQCIDQGWLSSKGKFIVRFEKKFAQYCNSSFAMACSSGTAAIELGLLALGIKYGDEVIVPSFTMISTALAVSHVGATPVFVDCDIATGNINILALERAVTKRTKAIIPVDIYGCPCDYKSILKFAAENRLVVIEDAAEALGSSYFGKHIGNVSSVTAFSLYVNKVITTGQGGIITTSSKEIYNKIKLLNNYYFSTKKHFWHEKIGYNFRMSNLQAAVGVAQIENIEKILVKKIQISNWYNKALQPLEEFIVPMKVPQNCLSNYWQIAYRIVDQKFDVQKLRVHLGKNGIETRSFFIPLHLQPPYYKKEYEGQFPNAELLAQTGFLLPSGPTLTVAQVERICSLIVVYLKIH